MKFIAMLVLTLLAVNVSFAELSFAQEALPIEGPAWIGAVLQYVQSIPKVGPIVSEILQIMGAVAAFFTSLVVFLQGVAFIPYISLKVAGAKEKADKFKAWADKYIGILKWLSIHNVKK